ncbi:MAG: glycosyltransferase family 2 protein [Nitrospirota bacterium]
MHTRSASNESSAPSVSVVISLYNKGKYIERALNSVFAQTHPPLEVIIVDDGSTDDGPDRALQLGNPKIILIRQDNRGPGCARNAGLAIARGKYIAFLDADDEWFPTFIESGLGLLENEHSNVTVVWTGYTNYPSLKPNNIGMQEINGVYEISSRTNIKFIRQILDFIWTCTIIVRTDTAKKWGGFFDQYKCLMGEDRCLFLKLLFNERFGIIGTSHAFYHREASDLSDDRKNVFQPAPYINNPEETLTSCPESKRILLKELLGILAFEKAEEMAKSGRGREAQSLLNHFILNDYPLPRNYCHVRLLIKFSPILPVIGYFWRNYRKIMHQLLLIR